MEISRRVCYNRFPERDYYPSEVFDMLELLAPAGSMDALRAAVQSGANAVYLGSGPFNARQNAKNFTLDELPDAVRYCHVRGVQVHLTLNTLVTDRELEQAAQTITAAVKAGVDAFIVQDLGLVSLLRQMAPEVPIHASTQMSIHSLEGVLRAAAMGMSRVVLARELSREDIAYICRNSPIEIEVFVHGALCMCYSGQCYFSAVVGTRSGNRGQCAQPCRLAYGFGRYEEKYPLSLKDNCLISWVGELHRLSPPSVAARIERFAKAASVLLSALPMMFLYRSIWDRKVIRNIGCLRGKDCAGEVQIVERTTSIKEAVRGFAENLAFGRRVS